MTRIVFLGALLAGAMFFAGGSRAGMGTEAAPLSVLFVGSSGMRSNDLPAKVARFAAVSGRELKYRAVLYAGFNLEDHLNLGAARAALASGEWDVVVLQEARRFPEDQEHLRMWAARWADLLGRRVPAPRY